ncbi:glycerate kinase [Alteribacillus iranensis]|uniref:Glycerate kinase n=1 Tax=Alteribacillus iranensis TaxID=930128 RepID=A0A1I2E2J1_9BACI|nr:glycerate kinase [Alteribacillus iranensis]SFE86909.1 glycerate kinase [Alteribacillus iranensis]
MKIIVAPDSFKGSLSAKEVSVSIETGIKKVFPDANTLLLPLADGGEGTMDTMITATGGEKKSIEVTGPLGESVSASYGILGDRKTCVIEMAEASGLYLVPQDKLDPMKATTYGTGELIKHALDQGYTSFILALGGSATNDGGAGMLQALGARLLDREGKDIGFGGACLADLNTIDATSLDKRIRNCTFLIASDVESPLIGTEGASYVFGPQKGASLRQVQELDANLAHWADNIEKTTGVRLHDLPGAGAAGGIGGAFKAFFDAEMRRGIDVVIKYTKLSEALEGADLLVTGEGQVDVQTAAGKTPMGAAQEANKQGVPTVILAGSVGEGIEKLYPFGVVSVHSIINQPLSLQQSMNRTDELLIYTAEQVIRTYFYHRINDKKRNR